MTIHVAFNADRDPQTRRHWLAWSKGDKPSYGQTRGKAIDNAIYFYLWRRFGVKPTKDRCREAKYNARIISHDSPAEIFQRISQEGAGYGV